MKKLIFAAMMALSCTFAFADTNPVQSPDWRVVFWADGERSVFWDGNYCDADVLLEDPFEIGSFYSFNVNMCGF
jgi:hypothetical protein